MKPTGLLLHAVLLQGSGRKAPLARGCCHSTGEKRELPRGQFCRSGLKTSTLNCSLEKPLSPRCSPPKETSSLG